MKIDIHLRQLDVVSSHNLRFELPYRTIKKKRKISKLKSKSIIEFYLQIEIEIAIDYSIRELLHTLNS